MKLQIEFSKNTTPVPFDYMKNLNGYLHKVLGSDNKFHDKISLYSTSMLHGGKMNSDSKSLDFKNGAKWFVSSPDKEFISEFVKNLYNNCDFAFGMELIGVNILKYELNNNGDFFHFKTSSPVLLKEKDDSGKNVYLTYEDNVKTTSDIMKSIILKKSVLHNLNFEPNDFEIFFDYEYPHKKTKWVKIKSIGNKTSVCPIIIKSSNLEIVDFIYNVGVGHSTGSGLGSLL